jgi:transcription elongation GreA/GreB family factor
MSAVDKRALVEAAKAELSAAIAALTASADATREGVTHEETKQEDPKDTRGLEASYLARGQAQRVVETQDELSRLHAMELPDFDDDAVIVLSAVVTLDVDGQERHYFLVPGGGGTEVTVDGVSYQLITPTTPLGRALIRREVGDCFELKVAGNTRECEIIAVN